MERQFTKRKKFVPDLWGNFELPSSEQITVEYTNPSMEMRARINPSAKYSLKTDTFGNPIGGEAIVQLDDKALISGFNIRINGYVLVDEHGAKTPIRNCKDLFEADAGEVGPLVTVIAKHFREELREDADEKNLESPSD